MKTLAEGKFKTKEFNALVAKEPYIINVRLDTPIQLHKEGWNLPIRASYLAQAWLDSYLPVAIVSQPEMDRLEVYATSRTSAGLTITIRAQGLPSLEAYIKAYLEGWLEGRAEAMPIALSTFNTVDARVTVGVMGTLIPPILPGREVFYPVELEVYPPMQGAQMVKRSKQTAKMIGKHYE